MKILTQADVARLGAYKDIVEALREGFRAEIATPVRHHHDITNVSTLLLMPAWSKDWAGTQDRGVQVRQCRAGSAHHPGQLSPDRAEDRRDGGHDGWRRDHPPPHRRGLGSCRRLPCPQGCGDDDAGGRWCAGSAFRAGPCRGAPGEARLHLHALDCQGRGAGRRTRTSRPRGPCGDRPRSAPCASPTSSPVSRRPPRPSSRARG